MKGQTLILVLILLSGLVAFAPLKADKAANYFPEGNWTSWTQYAVKDVNSFSYGLNLLDLSYNGTALSFLDTQTPPGGLATSVVFVTATKAITTTTGLSCLVNLCYASEPQSGYGTYSLVSPASNLSTIEIMKSGRVFQTLTAQAQGWKGTDNPAAAIDPSGRWIIIAATNSTDNHTSYFVYQGVGSAAPPPQVTIPSGTCPASPGQWFFNGYDSGTLLFTCTMDEDPYVTVNTSPAGIPDALTVNGTTYTTFGPILLGAGQHLTISALQTVYADPLHTYTFSHWSDSEARTHTVTIPVNDTTYTAFYNLVSFNPPCVGNPLEQIERGCIVPGVILTWSLPMGMNNWLALVLLGANVAVYNKSQSIVMALVVLMLSGGVFMFALPAYFSQIGNIMLYLATAGLFVKLILGVRG